MIKDIKKKRLILEEAKRNVKSFFIGLDEIIDKVFASFEIWYFIPELLERPIIINLWGMTGTGKTDLVRRIVQELSFEEKYLEIQLSSSDRGYPEKIQDRMQYSGISSKEPGILLLDEMQRFRTLDEEGAMLNSEKYDDIWMLLSDGKFSDAMREREKLINLLLEYEYSFDYEEEQEDAIEEKPNKKSKRKAKKEPKPIKKYKTSLWKAESIKRKLELSEPTGEIMLWSQEKIIEKLRQKINEIKILRSEAKTYNQLLIFVCGNIDEAFSMSSDVSEVNVDADILHEFSKNVNILKIKEALGKKFKPEQIARFGNNHIIYPSLSKKNFEKLISKKLNEITERIKRKFDIEITFSPNIHLTLYRNGVYPTQGTRPIFSTINNIIENSLPIFLFNCFLKNKKIIHIDIDETREIIFSTIDKELIERKVDLQLETLTQKITKDTLSRISVHESGHAVIYALLFKVAPSQIVGNSIGDYSQGFIIPHNHCKSKNMLIKSTQTLLGGIIAEELIFGDELKGSGSSGDIDRATSLVADMVRSFNMDSTIGKIVEPASKIAENHITSIEETNQTIETILNQTKSKTKDLLQNNMNFYKSILNQVLKLKRVLPEEFVKIAKEFIPGIEIKKNDFIINENYYTIVNKFLELKKDK